MSLSLDAALAYLREEVAPKANRIDRDPEALRSALRGLGDRHLLALRRPVEFGGPAWPETDFRAFQEAVARASGTLAFLQTQHQSAVSMIAKGENEALKHELLPQMGGGGRLVGIGFSQLRRQGPPALRAERQEGGYRLSGHVPWVTGFSFFGDFLVGAALPDGRAVFGLAPFQDAEGIRFSEPMRLAAMEAAMTVTADLDGFWLPDEFVAFHKPPDWIHENDQINVTLQGFFALGCAQAGLDVMDRAHQRRPFEPIAVARERLQAELDCCRRETMEAIGPGDDGVATDDKLKLRAWAIDLAVRCAHAGVTATSGAANSLDNDAQRVYREALVYTVSAQTSSIMQATLERLAARG